ncbi:unnamed protein product [Linum tenue]|uniref:Peptide chain release factor 2 n=1 Tax=Linum tenue TaxID=586396 RepID=A0AAV0LQ76_9ROSI|nr:unnamed protein product [Linum tenue]
MSALALRRSRICSKSLLAASFLCPLQPEPQNALLHSSKLHSSQSVRKNHQVLCFSSNSVLNRELQFRRRVFPSLSTHAAAAAELSTSDGLTVDRIVASNWAILDESESDWKSHAAAIAQSIQVIKKRLQWNKLMVRLDLLSAQLNKPNLWDDHVLAGKLSREHGSMMGKMKEVKALEQDLIEHIDMIKLAREEAEDSDLELVGNLASCCLGIIESHA